MHLAAPSTTPSPSPASTKPSSPEPPTDEMSKLQLDKDKDVPRGQRPRKPTVEKSGEKGRP